MVIERTPEINKEDLFKAIISPPNKQIEEISTSRLGNVY